MLGAADLAERESVRDRPRYYVLKVLSLDEAIAREPSSIERDLSDLAASLYRPRTTRPRKNPGLVEVIDGPHPTLIIAWRRALMYRRAMGGIFIAGEVGSTGGP